MTNPKSQRREKLANRTTEFHHLPLDLIADVLCRLSMKTLMLCKCVSKRWRSLTEDKYFIDYHLKRSIEKNTNSVIFQSSRRLRCARMDSPEKARKIPELSWLERCYYPPRDLYLAKCSCNGLVIFISRVGFGSDIIISNVSTGEYVMIPSSPYHLHRRAYGFGYDSVSDDYKLVLVYEISEFRHGSWVYSMKRNEWVRGCNFSNLFPDSGGVVVKGFVNWRSWRKQIVAFDLDTEEFRLVPLPNRRKYEYTNDVVTVDVLRGCLLMTIPRKSEIEMWVMKDYMVKESWTKLYTIPCGSIFICSISSNEFLLRNPLHYDYTDVYRYNPMTRERIPIQGNAVDDQSHDTDTVVFVESLVQIRKLLGSRAGRPKSQ